MVSAWPPGSNLASGMLSLVSWHLGRGRKLDRVTTVPWCHHILSLVILKCLFFHLKEGKGITFLLHRVKIMYVLCSMVPSVHIYITGADIGV